MPQLSRHHWIIVLALLAFGGLFVVEGPLEATRNSSDLAHLYAAASLWLQGGNPYDGQACVEALRDAGHTNPEAYGNGSFYPPPTLAALSPIALLPWHLAKLAWLMLNLIAAGAVVWALAHWLTLRDPLTRWLVAALLVLAWGPVATTLSLGQLALVSSACVMVAMVLLERGKSAWIVGLLVAMGCLIKPQLGLGFLLLIMLRREGWASAVAVATIAILNAIAIARLMQFAPAWSSQLIENISRDQSPGQVLDASPAGSLRYQMLDIRPLLHYVLPGAWVNLSGVVIVLAMTGLALWKLLRAGLREHALLAASGVGLLVLLPVYHRHYDAVLLLPLLALLINTLMRDRSYRLMWLIAVAMVPVMLPLPSLLLVLNQRGIVPEAIHASWPWRAFVLQIHSWCLLIAAVALVAWTYRHIDSESSARG